MKKQDTKKKIWIKPEVYALSIKKDTFSGSLPGNEKVPGHGRPPRP